MNHSAEPDTPHLPEWVAPLPELSGTGWEAPHPIAAQTSPEEPAPAPVFDCPPTVDADTSAIADEPTQVAAQPLTVAGLAQHAASANAVVQAPTTDTLPSSAEAAFAELQTEPPILDDAQADVQTCLANAVQAMQESVPANTTPSSTANQDAYASSAAQSWPVLDASADIQAWLRQHLGVHAALRIDSRHIQAGDAFLALPGAKSDGRQWIAQAAQRGAAAILVHLDEGAQISSLLNDLPEDFSTPLAVVVGLRLRVGSIASAWLDDPSQSMSIVAVTGTNGKTSTAWWIAQAQAALSMGEPASKSPNDPSGVCALMGTLGVGVPAFEAADPLHSLQSTGLTTPDAASVQSAFAALRSQGVGAVAMEASSIGLEQGRLDGTHIRTAIFTNCTQDHLDYHGTMDAYWAAKRRLFDWPALAHAAINLDDSRGQALAAQLAQTQPALDVWTVAIVIPEDDAPPSRRWSAFERLPRLFAHHLHHDSQGVAFTLTERDLDAPALDSTFSSTLSVRERGLHSVRVRTQLIGQYNVSNLLGVAAALRTLGHSLEDVARALEALTPVPGRMQQIAHEGRPRIVIDYAHTPDAIEQALAALRPVAAARGGRLVCVFGCGGNRDATKRPLMARAAQHGADRVIITSDNPRLEDPLRIIEDILTGIDRAHPTPVRIVPDRARAIARAVADAHAADVILIAGKGHEDYQDIAGTKHPFSDWEQACMALAAPIVPALQSTQAGSHDAQQPLLTDDAALVSERDALAATASLADPIAAESTSTAPTYAKTHESHVRGLDASQALQAPIVAIDNMAQSSDAGMNEDADHAASAAPTAQPASDSEPTSASEPIPVQSGHTLRRAWEWIVAQQPDARLNAGTDGRSEHDAASGMWTHAREDALRWQRVCTDSRNVRTGDLFVALAGERVDGHDYLSAVRDAGAAAAIVAHGRSIEALPCVEVGDTTAALGALAAGWRAQFALPLIAVTGSNGKTTVTQMLHSILRAHAGEAALATQGNFNNAIGVPWTLFRLQSTHRIAVVELGMNHPGEIAPLARMSAPTVALVNNAQREHQEFMHTVEAVARENGSVFEYLREGGTAVFPAGDAYSGLWKQLAGAHPVLTFGEASAGAHVYVLAQRWADLAWQLHIHTPKGDVACALHIAGAHNVRNALAATACALAAGVPLAAIAQGLENFRPVAGRSSLRALHWPHATHGAVPITLVDDTYNANPDSVAAAIDVLAALPAPRLLVLGDMAEVGDNGPAFHAEAGALAASRGINTLMTLGALATHAAHAFGPAARHFQDMDALIAAVTAHMAEHMAARTGVAADEVAGSVLIKGSRSMKMERLGHALMEHCRAPEPEPST